MQKRNISGRQRSVAIVTGLSGAKRRRAPSIMLPPRDIRPSASNATLNEAIVVPD